MIRTTYRGRAIKVLAVRGKPTHRKLVINGHTTNHAWEGNDQQALDWFKQIIDRLEELGGAGIAPSTASLYGQYTQPHWYEPGAVDINPNGHATRPGSICLCTRCTTTDKSWFAPLPVDACRFCHQSPDQHKNDYDLMNTHFYKEPTEQQRAGRQASIDDVNQPNDPNEASCDAIYPDEVRGYLGRPRCLYFADHRDARDPDYHADHRGFRWTVKAA